MRTITERDLIRGVADAWFAQHAGCKRADQVATGNKLRAMDKETASAEQVAEIIGNRSWTDLQCHECGAHGVKAVVEVGVSDDYDGATARLCFACIRKAAALAHNAVVSSGGTPPA